MLGFSPAEWSAFASRGAKNRRRCRPDTPSRAARASSVSRVQDMREPGRTAIGTWSGGRFLRFGEAVEEERLAVLLRPGEGIDTVLSADAYGAGEADRVLGRALQGVPRGDYSLVGAVGHDFYAGERDGPRGFPRFTDPRAARAGRVRRLPADGRGAQPRADRRRLLRRAAPPQPRPQRLQQRGGLGRDGGAARGRPRGADRRRARPGQRLHARPDLLPGALRRADRLGDDHPQPVRALARRALPRRRRRARRQGDHAGRRLRRPLLGRPAARHGAGAGRPPRLSPRRAGSRRASRSWSGSRRSPSGRGSARSSSPASGTSPTRRSSASSRP